MDAYAQKHCPLPGGHTAKKPCHINQLELFGLAMLYINTMYLYYIIGSTSETVAKGTDKGSKKRARSDGGGSSKEAASVMDVLTKAKVSSYIG